MKMSSPRGGARPARFVCGRAAPTLRRGPCADVEGPALRNGAQRPSYKHLPFLEKLPHLHGGRNARVGVGLDADAQRRKGLARSDIRRRLCVQRLSDDLRRTRCRTACEPRRGERRAVCGELRQVHGLLRHQQRPLS